MIFLHRLKAKPRAVNTMIYVRFVVRELRRVIMRISIAIDFLVDIQKLGSAKEYAFKHSCVFVSKHKQGDVYEVTLTARNLYPHEVDPFIQKCREFSIPFEPA